MSKIKIILDTDEGTCEVSINGNQVKGSLCYLSLYKGGCYDSKHEYYFSAEFSDLEDGNALKNLGEDVQKAIVIRAEAGESKATISSKNNPNQELSKAIAFLKT